MHIVQVDQDELEEEEGVLEIVYSKLPPTKNTRYRGGVRTNLQAIYRRPGVKPVKHEKSPELEEDEEEEENEDRE